MATFHRFSLCGLVGKCTYFFVYVHDLLWFWTIGKVERDSVLYPLLLSSQPINEYCIFSSKYGYCIRINWILHKLLLRFMAFLLIRCCGSILKLQRNLPSVKICINSISAAWGFCMIKGKFIPLTYLFMSSIFLGFIPMVIR